MNYLALYRKYRPTDISSVVDQEEVKKILASSIINNTISHAYLFSGPRGTGKTTMAKIFAKMVNCEHPVDGHPCNECNSCLNLFNSNDIIEIDAASNNGVEEIRDLREKVNLVPSMCKYKVYIIDEVHMLTTQAFNALLKTLEEPPKHVIFILATTEYYKIPMTVTSRCQKFQFNKISIESIVDRLKYIAMEEKIDISADALYEIAKISDGGMRDSINFLDQLRSYKSDKIDLDDVYDVCGSISFNDIANLFINIKKNNIEFVINFFENMNANGKNYNKFFEDVTDYLKNVILYKNDVNIKLIKCNVEYLREVSKLYSIQQIFILVDDINNLIDRLKFASRQSVIVISSFLSIMYKFNKDVINKNQGNTLENEDVKKEENTILSIDMQSDKIDVKEDNVEKTNNDINYINKNKDILINNAFAVADKNIKNNLQKLYMGLNEYLTDKKYSLVSGILVDTEIQVAGDNYLILTGKYDAIIEKVLINYRLCEELINKLFGKNYHFVIITNEEWDNLKNVYINNLKEGKKYYLMNLDSEIIDNEILDKEPTFVDKLFSIVGSDVVEFK